MGAAGRGGSGGAGRYHAGRAVAPPGRPHAALPAAAGARHAAAPLGRPQRPPRRQLLPAAAGAPAAPPARPVRAGPGRPLSSAPALSPSRRAGRARPSAGDPSGLVRWRPAPPPGRFGPGRRSPEAGG